MKPKIIDRIDSIEERLEAAIRRIMEGGGSVSGTCGDGVLVGTVIAFAGDMKGVHPINPVTGKEDESYVLCNGETYFSENLGGMIQTPDLRDRFILGSGDVFLSGQTGGTTQSVFNVEITPTTLTLAQIPPHTHGFLKVGSSLGGGTKVPTVNISDTPWQPQYGQSTAVGSGQPHTHQGKLTFSAYDKLPPYRVLRYLMKI